MAQNKLEIKRKIFGLTVFVFDSMINLRKKILSFYCRQKLKNCGKNVRLRFPLCFENMENIEIGDNVSFASFVHIWGAGGVSIGDNTMIASHTAIFSTTHDYKNEKMHESIINKPVHIGKNVWIGAHSVIYPGVAIGDGSVIGANTIVNKDVPANAVFYGSPGKVIKYRGNQQNA